MDIGLKGKVALVTAGSRGLGRAAAAALAAEGARVVVVARPSAALDEFAAADPEGRLSVAGDLLDPELPQRAVGMAVSRFGRLDVAIVNTPGPRAAQPLDATDKDFTAAFDSVFYPAFRTIRAAAVPMCAQGWGRILIVSSTSVKAPKPFLCLSAASRSALWAWAKSAAPALYERGVTINALFAGPHDTDRARELGVKKERIMGRPEDFGSFATALCGEATRFVTGSGFLLDGGELMAP